MPVEGRPPLGSVETEIGDVDAERLLVGQRLAPMRDTVVTCRHSNQNGLTRSQTGETIGRIGVEILPHSLGIKDRECEPSRVILKCER